MRFPKMNDDVEYKKAAPCAWKLPSVSDVPSAAIDSTALLGCDWQTKTIEIFWLAHT